MNIWKDLDKISVEEKLLYEMARVGDFDKYIVVVRTNDPGKIPHFHIMDSQTWGSNFHTCVQFCKAEYFHHTRKEDVLNSSMRKQLVSMFNSECDNKRYKNNWEYALSMWNDNNSSVKVDEALPMPNYLNLR